MKVNLIRRSSHRPLAAKPLYVTVLAVALAVLGASVLLLTRERPADPSSPTPSFVTVPESIPHDCSRPVDAEINRFLRGVRDDSVIVFPFEGCYAQDGTFEVVERKSLTIDGNGSTFKAVTPGDMCRSNWRVIGGSDITLKNMTVRGVNTTGFDGPRRTDWCQHGYSFDSVQAGQLLRSRSYDTSGDPIAIGPDSRGRDVCVVPPSRRILVDEFHGLNSGRTVSITSAEEITIQRSYFGDIYDNAIDIETDEDCEPARNIRILDNRFGRHHYALLAYTGAEKEGRGGGLEISGNVSEAEPSSCFPAIYIKPGVDDVRRNNFIIRDNRLKTLSDGISIYQARHARIERNIISKNYAGCGVDDRFLVTVEVSENVNVYGNQAIAGPLGGFGGELRIEKSSGVTQTEPELVGPLPPLPSPVDVAPEVRIVAPQEGTVVSGKVNIEVEAHGENLRQGEFSIDGKLVKTDRGPTYSHEWDATGASKGPHTIAVVLHNALGMKTTRSITVMVS